MYKNQENVRDFMLQAGQNVESSPAFPDQKTRILRVKLLLEEVLELAEASGVEVTFSDRKIESTKQLEFQASGDIDLVEVADALTDIDYVNVGAALAYGIDLEPCHEEVHDSNMSKFIDGYRREDGKWMKGPSYRPADLDKVVSAQCRETQFFPLDVEGRAIFKNKE